MVAPFLAADSADSADKGSDPCHMILVSRLRIVQIVQIGRISEQRPEISSKKMKAHFLAADSADSADKRSDSCKMILVSRLQIVGIVQIVRKIDQMP